MYNSVINRKLWVAPMLSSDLTKCHGYGEDPSAAQEDGMSCVATEPSNPEGIGETRGRRQKAEVMSRAETRQAGRGQTRSATGDQSGGKHWKVGHNTRTIWH